MEHEKEIGKDKIPPEVTEKCCSHCVLGMVLNIYWNRHVTNREQNYQARTDSEACVSLAAAAGARMRQCHDWYTGYQNME